MKSYYRIAGTVKFPEGLAAGEGREFNEIALARNGMGLPVLRGTSIAGAIRTALLENGLKKEDVEHWFGKALEGNSEQGVSSKIRICDVVLKSKASEFRTHNMIDRNCGSVIDKGLFSIESLSPGTEGFFILYLEPETLDSPEKILRALKHVFGGELLLGGNKNRGIGRMDASSVKCLKVDVETAEGFAAWQNLRYRDRMEDYSSQGEPFPEEDIRYKLNLDLTLKIPQGEDIVVGYGTTLSGLQGSPQYVYKSDGKKYWRIPGGTFRGVFRSWMTRLAKNEGCELRYQKKDLKADLVGWGGVESGEERKEIQENPECLNDPILDLFGSLYKCGRIHFSDAYSVESVKSEDVQKRTHVAIDAFSGGTNPGMLFTNEVLTAGTFKMKVSVTPSHSGSAESWKRELNWLKKTLYALHLGIISIGSSKGSGLLEIENWDEVKEKLDEKMGGVN